MGDTYEHHGGSFGNYMRQKISKLHVQNNQSELDIVRSQIFQGMVFFINGHTATPVEELRHLIKTHGGEVDIYESSRVTHKLCTHLPDTKVNRRNAAKLARGAHQQVPIIHPDFIHECIKQNSRLPHADFVIDGLKGRHGGNIRAFISSSSASSSASVTNRSSHHHQKQPTQQQHEYRISPPSTPETTPSSQPSQPCKSSAPASMVTAASCILLHHHQDAAESTKEEDYALEILRLEEEESSRSSLLYQASSPLQQHHHPAAREETVQADNSSSSPSLAFSMESLAAKDGQRQGREGGSSRISSHNKAGGISSTRLMSTKEDPDFVTKYFKTSRLSFISRFKSKMQVLAAETARERRKQAKHRAIEGGKGCEGVGMSPDEEHGHPVILHVDMDCFFVSALIRNRPEFADQPLAVAHGEGQRGESSSEIASCNYPARAKGVRASMWIGDARKVCPELKVLHYDFDVYEEVATTMYSIFFEEAELVEVVSCDEAYLQLPSSSNGLEVASRVRQRIMEATGCPASAGVSSNMSLARLATRFAKPNGQYLLQYEEALHHLDDKLPLNEIHGIGWKREKDLKSHGITTCSQLRDVEMSQLQLWFGQAIGLTIYNSCRGIDDRQVNPEPPPRGTLGANINWGVRFSHEVQVKHCIRQLASEVSRRLKEAKLKGRQLVLNLKRSTYGPNEPPKFLGCGECDDVSSSENLPRYISSSEDIAKVALRLFERQTYMPVELIRGFGIQMSNLESDQDKGSPAVLSAWLNKERPNSKRRASDDQDQRQHAVIELLDPSQTEEENFERSLADVMVLDGEAVDGQEDKGEAETVPRKKRRKYNGDDNDVDCSSPAPPSTRASSVLCSAGFTSSQIHPETFEELPEAIREQIIREMREADVIDVTASDVIVQAESSSSSGTTRVLKRTGSSSSRHGGIQTKMDEYAGQEDVPNGIDPEIYRTLPLSIRRQVAEHPAHQHYKAEDVSMVLHAAPAISTSASATGRGSAAEMKHKQMAKKKSVYPTKARPSREVLTVKEDNDNDSVEVVEHGTSYKSTGGVSRKNATSRRKGEGGKVEQRSRLFMDEDVADVRRALLAYINSIPTPSLDHLQPLVLYMLELVETGSEDRLWMLMRAFRRWLENRQKDDHWIKAYQAILHEIEVRIEEKERAWEAGHLTAPRSTSSSGCLKLAGLQLP